MPIIVLYSLFIVLGFTKIVLSSLNIMSASGNISFSFGAYYELFFNSKIIKNIIYSMYIAVSSAIIATSFGIWISYFIAKAENLLIKKIAKQLCKYGLILPYTYMTFLVVLFLGRTGIISRILFSLGLISQLEQFPQLLYASSGLGTILVFVIKGIPFITLFVVGIMEVITGNLEHVAETLGAKKITIFCKLFLPLSANSIIWSSTILFIYYLGAFEVPYLLATENITLATALYSLYVNPHIEVLSQIMAMNVIMFIIGILGAIIYSEILKKVIKWAEKF